MPESKGARYLIFAIFLLCYVLIAYVIERPDTLPLFSCYFVPFTFYLWIIWKAPNQSAHVFRFWIVSSIVFRLAIMFSTPSLSDDYYRFIWDGRLLAEGIHPFAEVPSYYAADTNKFVGFDPQLYEELNSKDNFTIYPPVAQLIFWTSAVALPTSIYNSMLLMKIVLIVFEIATLWIIYRLLRHLKLPKERLLLYSLNPLVILEVAGNLHFEGMMVFFLVCALYILLSKRSIIASSLMFALSVCTKLIPLMFLPSLSQILRPKKFVYYTLVVIFFSIVLFTPLLNNDILIGMSKSLSYYFQRFEFNASIYYLLREIGQFVFGFNIIHFLGPALALIAGILILYLAFRTRDAINDLAIFETMLFSLFIYFLSTTILHPWYIITLLSLSIFTTWRFPVIWTGVIFLSYAGYTSDGYKENFFLLIVEYVTLLAYCIYEAKRRHEIPANDLLSKS